MKLQILGVVILAVVLVLLAAVLPGNSQPALAEQPALSGDRSAEQVYWNYIPLVQAALSFQDDFEKGVGAWTPYLNYWRLNPQQWYWDLGRGYQGSDAYSHNSRLGVGNPNDGAHDALSMYLGQGSNEWTDYRYQVRFNAENGRQVGIWFRGTYQEVEDAGQWVTGYYFTVQLLREGTNVAKLWQLRTAEEHGDEPIEGYWYHFSNPMELSRVDLATPVYYDEWHQLTVEVVGPQIKCYVDDELAIEYTDTVGSIFLNGTVGLWAYSGREKPALIRFDDVLVEPLKGDLR